MGILIRHSGIALLLALGLLALTPPVRADFFPPAKSLELTTNDSASFGRNYSLGLSADLGLGDRDDPVNNTASLHGSYSRQLSPVDPTGDPQGPLKNVNNWAGGVSVTPFEKASLNVDLDSANDRFEMLFTNGVKVGVGYEPIKLSYRYASNTIEQTQALCKVRNRFGICIIPSEAAGAFIYEHQLELEADLELGENDSLTITLAGSTFSPGLELFANVLATQGLPSLSNFTDTLQNFSQYSYGPEWKHIFNDDWDAKLGLKISHEAISANTLFESTTSVGLKAAPWAHVALGWDYSHDATQVQNNFTFELRINWDRGGAEEAEKAGAKQGKKSLGYGVPSAKVRSSKDDEE